VRQITLEKKDEVAVITLNRPEKRNALTLELRQALYRILEDVDSDETTRAAIITGGGEAFAAGADIRAMQTYTVEDAIESSMQGSRVFLFLEKMGIPCKTGNPLCS
jgi:enoyl-CoA hydratase/carnithine racemase